VHAVAVQAAGKVSVPQQLILMLAVHINIQCLVRSLSDSVSSRRSICHCAVQLDSSWECRQGVALLYRGGRRREGPRGPPVWRGLWPTTQYIIANGNESSDCIADKLQRCARQLGTLLNINYAEQHSIMQNVS